MATGKSTERVGAAITVALHASVAAALLSYEPARSALLSVAPIMVSLVTPPRVQPAPPAPPPPKPRPVVTQRPTPPEPLPLITAPVETPSPSPIVVPPPPPAPIVAAPPVLVVAVTPPIFAADYLDNPAPAYPAQSRRNGEQGRVTLRVLVNAGGTADQVQIQTSSGHSRLDHAARDTVLGWRFVPARRGDEPVAAWVLIPISFRMDG